MFKTRIKICGITRIEDALCAIQFGADALGFVFYKPSPRFIDIERAKEIIRQLPPFVQHVALVVNPEESLICEIIESQQFSLLQFHGNETAEFCERFDFPYIKAIRVNEKTNLVQLSQEYKQAKALLLDADIQGFFGGTGQTFDWSLIANQPKLLKPIILAGGLTTDNVQLAIQQIQPFAVDVSGGVESTQKGIKDHQKIKDFIHNCIK